MKRFFSILLAYWKALGRLIGVVMTPVQMFLVYILGFGVASLAIRVARHDPLDRRLDKEPTFWRKKETHPPTLQNLRHTF